MAKDPCVLWYWNDWNGGTVTLNRHLKGCYMDLLHAHFNNGNMSLDEIRVVLAADFETCWPVLQGKFIKDEYGLFYNERLVFEKAKRQKFSKSRVDNLNSNVDKSKKDNHTEARMEIENEIEIRKQKFKQYVALFLDKYSKTVLREFFDYWTERSPNSKKMRFEMQKVFEMSRRLVTWKKRADEYAQKNNKTLATIKPFDPVLTPIEIEQRKNYIEKRDGPKTEKPKTDVYKPGTIGTILKKQFGHV